MTISYKNQVFLSERMCIDLAHLHAKIADTVNSAKAINIEEYINNLVQIINTNELDDPCVLLDSDSCILCSKIKNLYQNYLSVIPGESEHKKLLDTIRHAFTSFACGGLVSLYTYQENEGWYPKIILNSVLKPNDIDQLDSIVSVFRGCDKSELDEDSYGQAWTTCKNIAHDFAFEHYSREEWFDQSKRIILKAEINRSDIFYAKNLPEHEVVVNTKKLSKINICD